MQCCKKLSPLLLVWGDRCVLNKGVCGITHPSVMCTASLNFGFGQLNPAQSP